MSIRHSIVALVSAFLLLGSQGAAGRELVILHTNDTHSAIEPDASGAGGWLQRKAVIDSVRRAEKNVILVDAGDVAQGSLYFKYFGGDVEYPLMNMMGYDIQILGNHEFDTGMESLARHYKTLRADRLSANYDFTGTPLEGVLLPYVVKKVEGRKIGFFGLNLDPEGLIDSSMIAVKFRDIISTANETADFLRHKKKCDLVVAVTHIGYMNSTPSRPGDVELAKASRDIDIIIGGHSHTKIDPSDPAAPDWIVANADGRPVLVAQTGKKGVYLGEICIDLPHLDRGTEAFDYRLIPVTDRFPASALSGEMAAFLAPYRARIDSVNRRVVGRSLFDLSNGVNVGGLPNFTADMGLDYAVMKADSLRKAGLDIPQVDFALMNVGGIRQPMPKGDITEGELLAAYPFANRVMLVAIKGADFIEAMKVAAGRGGEAVSRNMRVAVRPDGSVAVLLDGRPLDPDREYVMATIDYLAHGNDDMPTLARNRVLWRDDAELCSAVVRYVSELGEAGFPVAPDLTPRFMPAVELP